MTRAIIFLVALVLVSGPSFAADAPAAPNAADILRSVREAQASRHDALDGQLRNDFDGKVFPFRLTADGPAVRYQFQGTPPTVVQVHYNEDGSQLEESTGGASDKLTPINFDKKILGTDLSYEDLALRFVYWSHATILGDDNVMMRDTWKLRIDAPTHHTEYSSVNLWVDKVSGALLQAEAYDWQGRVVKQFQVVSGQKLNDKWYLKRLRIESLDPADHKVRSRTYLEIKGLAK